MVIAIVDDGGHLIYLTRMDGTQIGSIDVAQAKARTALAFKRPTKSLERSPEEWPYADFGAAWRHPIEGGLPLVVKGGIPRRDWRVRRHVRAGWRDRTGRCRCTPPIPQPRSTPHPARIPMLVLHQPCCDLVGEHVLPPLLWDIFIQAHDVRHAAAQR